MNIISPLWEQRNEDLDKISTEEENFENRDGVKQVICGDYLRNKDLFTGVKNEIVKLVGDLNGKSILEIGGGYGNLCNIIQESFKCDYTMLDTPSMLRLVAAHLKKHNKFAKLVDANCWEQLGGIHFDLLIAINCLSECPNEYVEAVLDLVSKNTDRLFIVDGELGCDNVIPRLKKIVEKHFNKITISEFGHHGTGYQRLLYATNETGNSDESR